MIKGQRKNFCVNPECCEISEGLNLVLMHMFVAVVLLRNTLSVWHRSPLPFLAAFTFFLNQHVKIVSHLSNEVQVQSCVFQRLTHFSSSCCSEWSANGVNDVLMYNYLPFKMSNFFKLSHTKPLMWLFPSLAVIVE